MREQKGLGKNLHFFWNSFDSLILVITQIRRVMALIPMECKNSGKLDKYILLMMKDEMITMRDRLGFKYSLKVSLGEEA